MVITNITTNFVLIRQADSTLNIPTEACSTTTYAHLSIPLQNSNQTRFVHKECGLVPRPFTDDSYFHEGVGLFHVHLLMTVTSMRPPSLTENEGISGEQHRAFALMTNN